MLIVALALVARAAPTSAPAPAPAPAAAPAPVAKLDTDDAIRAEVSRRYGKPVPDAAVCIEAPTLGPPFRGDPVAVAVRRGLRGCVLFGVVVDGVWREPKEALAAALDPAAFGALDAAGKGKALLTWTDGVVLAFAQPSAAVAGTVTPSKGGWTVVRRALRRDDAAGSSLDSTTTWKYDAAFALVGEPAEQVHTRYVTSPFVRADHVEGVPEAAVDKALTDHGRVVTDCANAAWEANLALSGRVRLSWTIGQGKVGEVAVLAEPGGETPEHAALAKCYARAIRAGTYAPELAGEVTWVFAMNRTEVPAP